MPQPWGRRPVLLLARDEAYGILTWLTAAPLTTHVRDIPTFVKLTPSSDGVPEPCAVSLDNLQSVRRDCLDTLIVRLRQDKMPEVEQAIHFALRLRE